MPLPVFDDLTAGALAPKLNAMRAALGGNTENALSFGVVGDGTTNNAAALAQAIAATPPGGTLVFPKGDYGFTGVVTFTKSIRVEAYGATFRPLAASAYMQTSLISDFYWYGGTVANAGFAGTYGLIAYIKERGLIEGLAIHDVAVEGLVIVGDGREIYTCNATANTTTVTDTANGFTLADVGKMILVEGAGYGGAALEAEIVGYTSSSTVTLSMTVRTTVTAAHAYITTETKAVVRDLDVQNSGSCGLRANPWTWGVHAENVWISGNCAAGGAGILSHLAPRFMLSCCHVRNVLTNAIRLDGFGNKLSRCTSTKSLIHGIRLQGEQCEAHSCDVSQESTYTFVITSNAGAGSPLQGATAARDCKIVGGTSVGGGGVLISENTPVLQQVKAPVVKGLTIEGSSVAGLNIQSGNHADIDIVVRDCVGSGVFGANGAVTGAGVMDVNLRIQSYGNATYGIQTVGLCDRWRISGHARAAENTAGATALVGAGNDTTGLMT